MSHTVYTIGHSNGTMERLIKLLRQHSITAVADVRSQPYSRFNPQFNRNALADSLKDERLEYVFLGNELGARSDDPSCYRDGRAQYSLIARTEVFERGIVRLILEDGSLEDHEASVARLLEIHGLQNEELFQNRDERVALAYEKQAEQIQYSRDEASQTA